MSTAVFPGASRLRDHRFRTSGVWGCAPLNCKPPSSPFPLFLSVSLPLFLSLLLLAAARARTDSYFSVRASKTTAGSFFRFRRLLLFDEVIGPLRNISITPRAYLDDIQPPLLRYDTRESARGRYTAEECSLNIPTYGMRNVQSAVQSGTENFSLTLLLILKVPAEAKRETCSLLSRSTTTLLPTLVPPQRVRD